MSDPVKNSERLILVTGATGRQGGAVYQRLQKKDSSCAHWCGIPTATRPVD
jgi:nucleoside-diphosphate-sugar epimerase